MGHLSFNLVRHFNLGLLLCVFVVFPSGAFGEPLPHHSLNAFSSLSPPAENLSSEEWNLLVGIVAVREGRFEEARRIFSALPLKDHLLADYLLFLEVKIAFELGEHHEAIRFASQIRKDHPRSVWKQDVLHLEARSLLSVGKHDEGQQLLSEYRRTLRNPQEQRAADLLLVESLLAQKKHKEATLLLRTVALQSANEEEFALLSPVISAFDADTNGETASWLSESQQLLTRAESYAAHAEWNDVIDLLSSRHGHEERWFVALAYARLGNAEEAWARLEALKNTAFREEFYPEMLSRLAIVQTQLRKYDDAIDTLETLRAHLRAERHDVWGIIARMASIRFDQGKMQPAIDLWRRALDLKPRGELAVRAHWQLALCFLRRGQDDLALQEFDAMVQMNAERYHIGDRVSYWRGKILERLGKKDEAEKEFRAVVERGPYGYYRELASRRLSHDRRGKVDYVFVQHLEPTTPAWAIGLPDPLSLKNESFHLARALAFDRLGASDEVRRELRVANASPPHAAKIILWLAKKHEAYGVAYRIARQAFSKELEEIEDIAFHRFIWEQHFPQAYREIVRDAASKHGIDPRLVFALMWAESLFDPHAVSPAGALGLLQLMPTTAKVEQSHDLFLPSVNIMHGVSFLQKLADHFPENPVAWIAAYNAGEDVVARWLKERQDITDMEEWIETIPYRETNQYVKKVLSAYFVQQRLYSSTP